MERLRPFILDLCILVFGITIVRSALWHLWRTKLRSRAPMQTLRDVGSVHTLRRRVYGLPMDLLVATGFEEIVFRLPILLAFEAPEGQAAWAAIIASSFCFALERSVLCHPAMPFSDRPADQDEADRRRASLRHVSVLRMWSAAIGFLAGIYFCLLGFQTETLLCAYAANLALKAFLEILHS